MSLRHRRWSAIVTRWEPFLADWLAGRVKLHATHYRGAHDAEGRGWITLDGEQIASFGSVSWIKRVYELGTDLERAGVDLDAAHDVSEAVAEREGLEHLWAFERAVAHYPDLGIEEALASDDMATRALAMFDGRLGRRRLGARASDRREPGRDPLPCGPSRR